MKRLLILALAAALALLTALPASAADGERSADAADLFRNRHYTVTGTLCTQDGSWDYTRCVDGEDWLQIRDGQKTYLLDHLLYTACGTVYLKSSPGIVRTVVYEEMTYSGSGRSAVPCLPEDTEYDWESYSVEDCGCVTGRIETADLRFYYTDDGALFAIYANMFGDRSTVLVRELSPDVPAKALTLRWWCPKVWGEIN